MNEQPTSRSIRADEDPVCGMTVDVQEARTSGRTLRHGDREYVFCGRGCLLEFRDDPARYLDPAYTPSM
ncbi:MAG TPA: YHS domain-containing protein [Candidatus Limnocylindrales bacterium]